VKIKQKGTWIFATREDLEGFQMRSIRDWAPHAFNARYRK